jgi:hypothetical protein
MTTDADSTYLKHIKATVVKGDHVTYFIASETEPLMGRISTINKGVANNASRKRSADHDGMLGS